MLILITLLKVLLLFVCALLILVVLMQRPKQEGLGAAFGGGVTDSLLGAGTTSFLQRATVYMAVFYFISSTALAVLVAKQQRGDDAVALPLDAAPTPDAVAPPVGDTGLPGDPLDGIDLTIPPDGSGPDLGELDIESLVPEDGAGTAPEPAPETGEQPADTAPAPEAEAEPAPGDAEGDAGSDGDGDAAETETETETDSPNPGGN